MTVHSQTATSVSLVVVSHSPKVAEGVVDLAREMGGAEVAMAGVGGVGDPGHPIGTDALAILAALEEVWSEDGVLVLMDLGSAVMNAETAVDLLDSDRRGRVLLCEAPLVEGAVAAAAAASLGATLDQVASEARAGLAPKASHLGVAPVVPPSVAPGAVGHLRTELDVAIPSGLHARPAARFVATAARFDARVEVVNLTTGAGPVIAGSFTAVGTLGARQGHRLAVTAAGPEAEAALAALAELAADGFGDRPLAPTAAAGASPGTAVGPVVHLALPEIEVPDRPVDAPAEERSRLEVARQQAAADIRASRRAASAAGAASAAEIFDVHLLLLVDPELAAEVGMAIDAGATAERAWQAAMGRLVERFRALDDPYQRERSADVSDVGRRVLAALVGTDVTPRPSGPGILVAPDLSPGDTAALDPELVAGIVTAGGGPTSHAAIIARSFGIPAVVGVGAGVLALAEGTLVLVDGATGTIVDNPPEEAVAAARERMASERVSHQRASAAAGRPAVTRDGARIEVAANAGSLDEVARAVSSGADGVGLLRTELLFLGRDVPPSEEEHESVYRRAAEALDGRPLVVRTLDVGGDKPLPFAPVAAEANPFLGQRGLRLGLARPDLLRPQLRAIARVAGEHRVAVMFPMVTDLAELHRARAMVAEAAGGTLPSGLEVGVMVEVPALALLAGHFAPHVDFFSVGTNDLTQYTLAAERGNAALAALTDGLHPAVLSLVDRTVRAARAHGRRVAVCGELASDPAAVPVLVGLGVTELSVAPGAIAGVKEAVRRVDGGAARRLAGRALAVGSAEEVRQWALELQAE